VSTSTPILMRAVRQHRIGGSEVLFVEEVPRPEPLPTEVLVRVRAAGVNPVDCRPAPATAWRDSAASPLLGWDVSGVVERLGEGVTRFRVGDAVYGVIRFPHPGDTYAEYVTAPSRHLVAKPASLDHVHAAALPLAGLTAWQALVDTARLRAGQRLLVHAAAGGVGHLAVQIAKSRGAHVTGTASTAKHPFLRSLGIDEVIDYTRTRFEAAVADVDVVLDMVGGDTALRSLTVLRPGGLYIAIAGDLAPALIQAARAAGVRAAAPLVEPDHAALEQLTALVEAGRLRVEVQSVLPLEQAARAHELGETRRTRGKIVLEVAT
jgi:NADPH:quinone reductase-like Zn-dependent oxidoreductase